MRVALSLCRRQVKAAMAGGSNRGGSDGRGDTRGRVVDGPGWIYRLRVEPSPGSPWEEAGAQGRAQAAGGHVGVDLWRRGGRVRSRGSFESLWAGRDGESA